MKRHTKISARIDDTTVVIDVRITRKPGRGIRSEVNQMHDATVDSVVDLMRYKIPRFYPNITDVHIGH